MKTFRTPAFASDVAASGFWCQAQLSDGFVRQLQRALALDPERPDAWNNLGVALAFQGRDAEALERFVKAAPRERYAADLEQARALLRQL